MSIDNGSEKRGRINNLFSKKNVEHSLSVQNELPYREANKFNLNENQIIFTAINNLLNRLVENDLYNSRLIDRATQNNSYRSPPLVPISEMNNSILNNAKVIVNNFDSPNSDLSIVYKDVANIQNSIVCDSTGIIPQHHLIGKHVYFVFSFNGLYFAGTDDGFWQTRYRYTTAKHECNWERCSEKSALGGFGESFEGKNVTAYAFNSNIGIETETRELNKYQFILAVNNCIYGYYPIKAWCGKREDPPIFRKILTMPEGTVIHKLFSNIDDGMTYIATSNGLIYTDGNLKTSLYYAAGTYRKEIFDIIYLNDVEDPSERIMLATNEGVLQSRLDKTFKNIKLEKTFISDVTSLLAVNDALRYVGTNHGIYKVSGSKYTLIPDTQSAIGYVNPLKGAYINRMVYYKNTVFAVSENVPGIFAVSSNGMVKKVYGHDDDINNYKFNDIKILNFDNVDVLCFMSDEQSYLALYEDGYFAGEAKLDLSNIKSLKINDIFFSNNSIYISTNNGLWIGGIEGFEFKMDEDFSHPFKLKSNEYFYKMYKLASDKLLYVVNNESDLSAQTYYLNSEKICTLPISASNESIENEYHGNSLEINDINLLDGSFYICSTKGLYRLKQYEFSNELIDMTYYSVDAIASDQFSNKNVVGFDSFESSTGKSFNVVVVANSNILDIYCLPLDSNTSKYSLAIKLDYTGSKAFYKLFKYNNDLAILYKSNGKLMFKYFNGRLGAFLYETIPNSSIDNIAKAELLEIIDTPRSTISNDYSSVDEDITLYGGSGKLKATVPSESSSTGILQKEYNNITGIKNIVVESDIAKNDKDGIEDPNATVGFLHNSNGNVLLIKPTATVREKFKDSGLTQINDTLIDTDQPVSYFATNDGIKYINNEISYSDYLEANKIIETYDDEDILSGKFIGIKSIPPDESEDENTAYKNSNALEFILSPNKIHVYDGLLHETPDKMTPVALSTALANHPAYEYANIDSKIDTSFISDISINSMLDVYGSLTSFNVYLDPTAANNKFGSISSKSLIKVPMEYISADANGDYYAYSPVFGNLKLANTQENDIYLAIPTDTSINVNALPTEYQNAISQSSRNIKSVKDASPYYIKQISLTDFGTASLSNVSTSSQNPTKKEVNINYLVDQYGIALDQYFCIDFLRISNLPDSLNEDLRNEIYDISSVISNILSCIKIELRNDAVVETPEYNMICADYILPISQNAANFNAFIYNSSLSAIECDASKINLSVHLPFINCYRTDYFNNPTLAFSFISKPNASSKYVLSSSTFDISYTNKYVYDQYNDPLSTTSNYSNLTIDEDGTKRKDAFHERYKDLSNYYTLSTAIYGNNQNAQTLDKFYFNKINDSKYLAVNMMHNSGNEATYDSYIRLYNLSTIPSTVKAKSYELDLGFKDGNQQKIDKYALTVDVLNDEMNLVYLDSRNGTYPTYLPTDVAYTQLMPSDINNELSIRYDGKIFSKYYAVEYDNLRTIPLTTESSRFTTNIATIQRIDDDVIFVESNGCWQTYKTADTGNLNKYDNTQLNNVKTAIFVKNSEGDQIPAEATMINNVFYNTLVHTTDNKLYTNKYEEYNGVNLSALYFVDSINCNNVSLSDDYYVLGINTNANWYQIHYDVGKSSIGIDEERSTTSDSATNGLNSKIGKIVKAKNIDGYNYLLMKNGYYSMNTANELITASFISADYFNSDIIDIYEDADARTINFVAKDEIEFTEDRIKNRYASKKEIAFAEDKNNIATKNMFLSLQRQIIPKSPENRIPDAYANMALTADLLHENINAFAINDVGNHILFSTSKKDVQGFYQYKFGSTNREYDNVDSGSKTSKAFKINDENVLINGAEISFIFDIKTGKISKLLTSPLNSMIGRNINLDILDAVTTDNKTYIAYGNNIISFAKNEFIDTLKYGAPHGTYDSFAENLIYKTFRIVKCVDDDDFLVGDEMGLCYIINKRIFRRFINHEDSFSNLYDIDVPVVEAVKDSSNAYTYLAARTNLIFQSSEPYYGFDLSLSSVVKSPNYVTGIYSEGANNYIICTHDGVYNTQYRYAYKNELGDGNLADAKNRIFNKVKDALSAHIKRYHSNTSTITVLNTKAKADMSEYKASNMRIPLYDTSKSPYHIENDIVKTIAFNDEHNYVRAAVINPAMDFLNRRSTYSDNYYDTFKDPFTLKENNLKDIKYIAKFFESGMKELNIYVPTTLTFYQNNVNGFSSSKFAQDSIPRPNISPGAKFKNSIDANATRLRLYIYNGFFGISNIISIQITGSSLPLKIYKDNTYYQEGRAGQFDSVIQPSIVTSIPQSIDEKGQNIKLLVDNQNRICLDFCIYGTDAQSIKIIAE